MNNKALTIVIATLNSEKLLPQVLKSINMQSFPRSQIEILIVDGGSMDSTERIAKKYGCKFINNPKTVPAWGKYLAYLQVQSKYLMYLDSDEIIENTESIKKKLKLFNLNKNVRAVTGSGYRTPKNYSFINNYINEFGDPFSFFYYRLSKDFRFFIKNMKNKYSVVTEDKDYLVFNFSKTKILPIFELVAMGSIVDLNFLKSEFPEISNNPGLVPHIFNLLVSKGADIGIVKNDTLMHYSANSINKYLGKITSRVVNNIYTNAKEGFNGRNEFVPPFNRIKKYLFIPYTLTIIPVFIDTIFLVITRNNLGYIIHMFLCLYTSMLIISTKFKKLLGIKMIMKSYGQENIVKV